MNDIDQTGLVVTLVEEEIVGRLLVKGGEGDVNNSFMLKGMNLYS